eukprot:scaffold6774_cov66-Phaeocystis_antarctica.AAC.4
MHAGNGNVCRFGTVRVRFGNATRGMANEVNQPDNYLGAQHCLAGNFLNGRQWDDIGCTNKRKYVCQQPIY